MLHALILIYTHSTDPLPPVQLSRRARLNASVFSSTIHLICYFQRLVDIICKDYILNSYVCLLEYNLKKSEDFYTMYKNANWNGSRLAFTCLRIQEDVDSRIGCISCPSLWGAKNAQMGGSHIATLVAQHTLPYLGAAPPPLDDWRPTSDIIDWQIVREESIELDWGLRM